MKISTIHSSTCWPRLLKIMRVTGKCRQQFTLRNSMRNIIVQSDNAETFLEIRQISHVCSTVGIQQNEAQSGKNVISPTSKHKLKTTCRVEMEEGINTNAACGGTLGEIPTVLLVKPDFTAPYHATFLLQHRLCRFHCHPEQ